MGVLESALFECLAHDEYCVTCVRGISPAEVLSRLGVSEGSPPEYTPDEAVQHFGIDVPAVRIHSEGGWIFLLEVYSDIGKTFQPQLLTRLSGGTEAISAYKIMDGTAMAAHARDGELLATYVDWEFEPPKGPDPSRLYRALTGVGFFQEENEESDEWLPSKMVLLALEREFDLTVSPDVVNGPLPAVGLP